MRGAIERTRIVSCASSNFECFVERPASQALSEPLTENGGQATEIRFGRGPRFWWDRGLYEHEHDSGLVTILLVGRESLI